MKAILNNIDFENNKVMAVYIIPFLILIDTGCTIWGLIFQDWLNTAVFAFSTAYIICCLIMQVQFKVHKNFATFLYVYGFGIAIYAAHSLWVQDWWNGIIYGTIVVMNTIVLYIRINENKEELGEEKEHEETME